MTIDKVTIDKVTMVLLIIFNYQISENKKWLAAHVHISAKATSTVIPIYELKMNNWRMNNRNKQTKKKMRLRKVSIDKL